MSEKIICKICGTPLSNNSRLGVHLKEHNVSNEEYYLKYINNANHECAVCGKPTKFKNFSFGFFETCSRKCGRENMKKTFLDKYGYDNQNKNADVIKKRENTCIQKYGVAHPLSAMCTIQKRENTCIKKYGCKNAFQNENIKSKYRKTCLERYGYEYASSSLEFREKVINTKKNNNTLNSSKIEDEIFKYLSDHFQNTQRNYKSEKYPFMCDFYIPELELFIELNAHWTHGGEPFNSKLKKHKDIIKLWTNKNNKFYKSAINVWSIIDVNKRKIAKSNNINYLEIFSGDYNYIVSIIEEHIYG